VKPLVYSMQFRGEASPSAAGILCAALSAPSSALVTRIDGDGVHGGFKPEAGEEARFRVRVSLVAATGLDETGTIVFSAGNALHLRSVGGVVLGRCSDPHLRHGTLMWEVASGEGQFVHSSGRISSNFFVSDSGDVTDNQIGVIFVGTR
jgi:hypothetical protein